jgi:hypothetical protein
LGARLGPSAPLGGFFGRFGMSSRQRARQGALFSLLCVAGCCLVCSRGV